MPTREIVRVCVHIKIQIQVHLQSTYTHKQVVPNREIGVIFRFLAAADTLGPCWNGHLVGPDRQVNLDAAGSECSHLPFIHAHVSAYALPRALQEIGSEDVTDISNASNHKPWFITRDYYAQGLSCGENTVGMSITVVYVVYMLQMVCMYACMHACMHVMYVCMCGHMYV